MRASVSEFMVRFRRTLLYPLLSILALTLSFEANAWNIPTSPGPDFDIGTVLSNYTSAGGGELYLQPLKNNLMGESYDVDTGGLSFRHVDVSIPGNSGLAVEFSRRANGKSYIQYNGLVMSPLGYVWDIDLPYVVTRVRHDATANCNVVTPNSGLGTSIFSIGMKLYTPGSGDRDLGVTKQYPWSPGPDIKDTISANLPGYSGSDVRVTSDLWVSRCANSPNYPGVNGFEVRSPSGHTYFFDRERRHTSTFKGREPNDQNGPKSRELDNVFMFPSKVSDLHGNWVKYEYNVHGPTRIHSNDGREITIAYTSGKISRVSANGRHWDYSYNISNTRLGRIDLPDGETYWEFGSTGQGMSNNGMQEGHCSAKRYGSDKYSIYMRHPSGTKARFETGVIFNPITRVPSKPYTSPVGIGDGITAACSWGSLSPKLMMTRALLKKTLTLSDGSTRIWNYDYHQPAGNWGRICTRRSGSYCTKDSKWFFTPSFYGQHYNTGGEEYRSKKRSVIDPTGVKKTYTVNMDWTRFGSYAVGSIMKVETFPSVNNSTPKKTVTYPPYFQFSALGGHVTYQTSLSPANRRHLPNSKITTQDGDTYTEEYEYNIDPASANFGHMSPIETRSFSNVTTTPRIIQSGFQNDFDDWVLGLPKSYTMNGQLLATNAYNTLGQLTSQSSFGVERAEIAYRSDGTISSVKDALDRETRLNNWHRGQPREVIQAYGRPEARRSKKVIDDNGWVTETEDALLRKTGYQYDEMGRLTKLTPPDSWTSTNIGYDFPSAGGILQTITKGDAFTEITYDSMQQQVLQYQKDFGTNWESYVNSTYDGLGRAIFSSFASTSTNETDGTETVYDALGRIKETKVNGSVVSTTSYGAGHKRFVDDADNDRTTYIENGFGELLEILQPEGTKTVITRDIFGKPRQIQQVRMSGFSGPYVNQSQFLLYDDQHRLCDYYVPEAGSTRYEYDLAGQVTGSSKGHSKPNSCQTPGGDSLSKTFYDGLGQVKRIRYPNDIATPGFRYIYDGVGNQKNVQRLLENGTIKVHHRNYFNSLNLMRVSKTQVYAEGSDGTPFREFRMDYYFSPEGHHYQTKLPNGRWYKTHPDAFGRSSKVQTSSHGDLARYASYYPNGVIAGFARGRTVNGSYSSNGYFMQSLDDRRRPKRIQHTNTNGAVVDLTLSYDPDGRIIRQVDAVHTNRSRDFTYDAQGRLKSATSADPLHGRIDYTYDALNNLRTKTYTGGQWDGRNITLLYDSRNRLHYSRDKNAAGAYAFTGNRWVARDYRGNVTKIGALYLNRDMTNQPVSIHGKATGGNGTSKTSSTHTKHLYDGYMRRVKSVESNGIVRYNIYDPSGSLMQVYDATNDVRTDYIPGPAGALAQIKKSNGVDNLSFIHADHLGTGRAGTDDTGAIIWEDFHTPFGESLLSPAGNDNQADYTGHIRDSGSGLVYMQARYVDPVVGRFLSIDPVGMKDSPNPSYFNRYSYAINNPISMLDPTGMYACEGPENQCEKIHVAAEEAQAAITIVKEAVSSLKEAIGSGAELTKGQSETLSAISDHFGKKNTTEKGLGRVTSRLNEISKRIGTRGTGANLEISNKDTGGGGIVAEVGRFSGNVTVYQKAFRATFENSNISLSGILIHEAAHKYGFRNMLYLDEGNGPVNSINYARKRPYRAVKVHPNNPTCFITGGKCG